MKPIRIPVTPGENGVPASYPFACQFDMGAIQDNFNYLEQKIKDQEQEIKGIRYALIRTLELIEQKSIQDAAN